MTPASQAKKSGCPVWVQGVGFRPTVWRLAWACGLSGDVSNDGGGVLIRLWGEPCQRQTFLDRLQAEPPPLARIDAMERHGCREPAPANGFVIAESRSTAIRTDMSADAATCPDCVAETLDPSARRYRYPFTNCTNCGPRLSIIHRLPYDRPGTSMARFAMCPDCAAEYDDPADRRFHAQPIACPACGPKVSLLPIDERSEVPAGDIVAAAAAMIDAGAIVAVKGIGGYHLACDAANAEGGEPTARGQAPVRQAVRDDGRVISPSSVAIARSTIGKPPCWRARPRRSRC